MTTDPLEQPTIRAKPAAAAQGGRHALGTLLADRYRLLEQLGTGGFGVVYRARDLTLDADIALKVIHPDIAHDPDNVAFFRNEVRVARLVTHPNVCRLHDLVDGDDGCFITMEYVAGESLAAMSARARLALPVALAILGQVAAGLAAAHAAGVIHRDLKPSNVLVTASGRAVVVDFGIAGEGRFLGDGPQDIAGTRGYMAPEQARGAAIDARADVYAFGVLALVLTTGTRPIPAVTHLETGDAAGGSALALPVADPGPALATLPAPLAALIEACLAVDPTARPADARELVRRLAAKPRRRWGVVVGTIVAIAGAAAVALALRGGHRPAPRIYVAPLDGHALAAPDAWLGAAAQRLIVDELIDAYGLDAEAGAPPPAADVLAIGGTLAKDPSGRLHAMVGGEAVEAHTIRELALAAAARIAGELPALHPTAAELRAWGTHDAEAWRLYRRAQREASLERWARADALCDQAIARDPSFPLPHLELAIDYDTFDAGARDELATATRLLAAAPDVDEVWRKATVASRQLTDGAPAAAARTIDEARALPLAPRDRHNLELRWAIAIASGPQPSAAVPALQLLTEQYPDDASAYKLLAQHYLASDDPTAPTLALRYATTASALAPEDARARADLALAQLLAGHTAEARARSAELATLDPDDKRLARSGLFMLHMALGDPAEAEADARRNLTGTATERADGTSSLALLDLYWGRFADGVHGLVAAADLYDANGMTTTAAGRRMLAAQQAALIGDRATALAQLAIVGGSATTLAGTARVQSQLVGGNLAGARRLADQLAAGSSMRAIADLAIAAAAGDPAGVLVAYGQLAPLSSTIAYLYEVGDALEKTGRPAEAAATFERLARSSHAWDAPIAAIRAWYRLGLLRARAHDPTAADAFREVLARWGNARAEMPEVIGARTQLNSPRTVRTK